MKKRNRYKIFILLFLLVTVLCSCAEKTKTDSKSSNKQSDKDKKISDILQIGKNEDEQKSCVGKWYTEFSYQAEGDDEHVVYLFADVRDDGTYDLRWVEPSDPEDDTDIFKYKLVQSPEDITEKFIHIYYDEKNDQIVINADGTLVTLNREQNSEQQVTQETEENQGNVDWKESYIAFLSKLLDDPYLTGDFFYIDEDDIPEIIIKYSMGPAIYKYYQGNIVEVDKSEADGLGAFFLCEKGSVYAEYFGDETASIYDFYKMNEDGSVEPVVYICQDKDYDSFTESWYIDRNAVSKDEYCSKVEEIQAAYGDLRGDFDYNKSPSQLIDILESGDDIAEGPTPVRELNFEAMDTSASLKGETNTNAHLAYDTQLADKKNELYLSGDAEEGYIRYAYADIDGDSIDEFIISVITPYEAGCVAYIYDYNMVLEKPYLIYEGDSDITIYENGVIAAFSSNNHSLGLSWPYSLYRMGEYGEYEYETYVSSWDVEYGDYDNGEYFPYDIDANGNGIVYRLYGSYMDDTEFEIWENDNMPKESRVQLNYNEWSYE